MLEVGTKAPDFTLQDQDGKDVSLSDFKGKKSSYILSQRQHERMYQASMRLQRTLSRLHGKRRHRSRRLERLGRVS